MKCDKCQAEMEQMTLNIGETKADSWICGECKAVHIADEQGAALAKQLMSKFGVPPRSEE